MEDARAAALGRVAELKAQARRDSASSAQLREEIGTSLAASDHAAASAEGAIALADTLTAVKGRLDAELAESSPEWRSRTDFEAANAHMDVQSPVNQQLHHSEVLQHSRPSQTSWSGAQLTSENLSKASLSLPTPAGCSGSTLPGNTLRHRQ